MTSFSFRKLTSKSHVKNKSKLQGTNRGTQNDYTKEGDKGFCFCFVSLYLVRPSEGRMMTMKISSKKHLCIVT